jgi:hypothetical protein
VLAKRGELDELRTLANVGNEAAARQLPELLIKPGRGEEAELLRRFGVTRTGQSRASKALGTSSP